MNIVKKYCFFILIFIALSTNAFSQKEKSEIITAYINNFAKYIRWPNEELIDSFKIVIITENSDIIKAFKEYARKRKVKNKHIDLQVNSNIPNLINAHIIFLSSEKSKLLNNLYDIVEGLPILLVSEEYKEQRNIMINLYKTPQDQIVFEINKANVINQGLTVDPEILLAGGTEIDVANLYRKSQYNLREQQKNIERLTDSLFSLNQNIKTTLELLQNQSSEIAKQKDLLKEQKEKINSDRQMIDSQKYILSLQNKFLKNQKDSINKINLFIQNQLKEINKQSLLIKEREDTLATKQLYIEKLNKEIVEKNIAIESQAETLARQRLILFLLITIAVLIIVIITAGIIAYKKIKQKNYLLTEHKSELANELKEVEELNEQLKLANQYKSIFLASMSHELRTPLNSIIGYTGIILMGMAGSLNEEQAKQLTKVKNNAKHLLNLINDILDISKIEADRIELRPETFNLQDLVYQVIETVNIKAIEKNLFLTSSVHSDIILTTDLRRLKQVVLNLVINAINYTEVGGVHIETEKFDNGTFRLSIKDTGIGIFEEDIPRLFQPFQQIDTTLTKKNTGTGLGLYLSKKLINLLGGSINVKSKPGKGSEFFIEMPFQNEKGVENEKSAYN